MVDNSTHHGQKSLESQRHNQGTRCGADVGCGQLPEDKQAYHKNATGDDNNNDGDDSDNNGDDSNNNGDDSNNGDENRQAHHSSAVGDSSNHNGDDSNNNGDDRNKNGDDSNKDGDEDSKNIITVLLVIIATRMVMKTARTS